MVPWSVWPCVRQRLQGIFLLGFLPFKVEGEEVFPRSIHRYLPVHTARQAAYVFPACFAICKHCDAIGIRCFQKGFYQQHGLRA